jgi:16S rRNA (uracil1498-N3)-methyltransferase
MHERVFIVSESQVAGEKIVIEGEDVHHLTRVLRAKVGQKLVAKIPGQTTYECALESATNKVAELQIVETKPIAPKLGPKTHLMLSMPRPAVLSSLLPGVVELGLDKLTIVITQRSHLKKKDEISLERYRKIIRESYKQSTRDYELELKDVVHFSELPKILAEPDYQNTKKIFPWEEENEGPVLRSLVLEGKIEQNRDRLFFIGPEGGIEVQEADKLADLGFIKTKLTPAILKVETAVLYTLSLLLEV